MPAARAVGSLSVEPETGIVSLPDPVSAFGIHLVELLDPAAEILVG